jgi:ribosome-binding ATPase YchF (GTP1/OBG family)
MDMMRTISYLEAVLQDGKMGYHAVVPAELQETFSMLDMLTTKPVVYLCNVDVSLKFA